MKCDFAKTGRFGLGDTPVYTCTRSACGNFAYVKDSSKLTAECKHPFFLPGTILARFFALLGVAECERCKLREKWLNEHLGFPLPGWLAKRLRTIPIARKD